MGKIDIDKNRTDTYEVRDNTYVKEKIADVKRNIEVEIGDMKSPDDFIPQFKTKHWDNECNFSVRFVDSDFSTGVIRTSGDTIEWSKDNVIARFYEKPDIAEDGGFEFEIQYAQKPVSNITEFSIQTKNLVFYRIGELTEFEKSRGAYRPENIVNSVAVYHRYRKHNWIDKHYRTGKFCHIFRPKAIDKDGNWVWCDLVINERNNQLWVITPQKFLDTAAYPVIIDPEIGYTSIGGTQDGPVTTDTSVGTKFTGAAGNATSGTMYGRSASGTPGFSIGVYDDNANEPDAFLFDAVGSLTTSDGWRTSGAISESVSAIDYWLLRMVNATWYGYYDAVAADAAFIFPVTYPTWPNPAGAGTFTDYLFSVYLTYDVPVSAAIEQEGYRFRNDDGSETTATWRASQDTPVSINKNTNTRLRILLDATDDPDSADFQIEYRIAGSSDPWLKIN